MFKQTFGTACLLGAASASKFQLFARDHHLRDNSEITFSSIQAPAMPENNFWQSYWESNDSEQVGLRSMLGCVGCTAAVDGAARLLEVPFVHNGLLKIASDICILSGFAGDRFKICPQLIEMFGEPMFDVFEQYLVTRDRICDERMGLCKSPTITAIDLTQVVNNILATKPMDIRNDDYIQNLYKKIEESNNDERPTLRALHLSDVHLDFEYTVGATSNCKEYLCCRADAGYPKKSTDIPAGYWGSSNCDIPVRTFQSMLDFVSTQDLPDMVFWTGDNSAHNIWDNTADESVAYTVKVTEMIKDTFDGKPVTVMPIQGNHDTWAEEIESFAAPGINYEINNFKSYWKDWLSDEAYEKFGEYGYYSQEIKLLNDKQLPDNTYVLAYNTQACNSLNWYTWGQREDPGDMFAWLELELLKIEAMGGIAFMISHYTPNQCQHQFGTRYRALMERFQNTVRFTMHGHTHTSYFELVQSMSNPGTPIMLANVGGSVTTYSHQNPSYQIIEFDQEYMVPINMYTYYLDLDQANETNEPTWALLHDYKEEYGLSDLSPASMKDLTQRFLTDADTASLFRWNMHAQRGSRPTSVDQVELSCMTASSEMHEMHGCIESGGESNSVYGSDYSMWSLQGLVDWVIGDWINITVN